MLEKTLKNFGLTTEIADQNTLNETIKRFKEQDITLPTFAQIADPNTIPQEIKDKLKNVDPNEANPLNLFRVHWHNGKDRKTIVDTPVYIKLTKEITGIDATILVIAGALFPMIDCHKVLAAYACLAPRVILGAFNPTKHLAVWPSTGNYCRGGVAISRLMACRGVAILPENMSKERFNWLQKWCVNPKEDIIPTYGCESNVKEIYDKCNELDQDPRYFIFNQFAEFNNHMAHYHCTGRALEKIFLDYKKQNPNAKLQAFISATGSAGTIGAGDYLKEKYGSKTVVVEALECPTLLYNGYGDHNIQGIGDKHVPLVHNVMNTDLAIALTYHASDKTFALYNTEAGQDYLKNRRHVSQSTLDDLKLLGLSSCANILSAIKTAKYLKLGKDDVLVTVATDSASMYGSELESFHEKYFKNGFTNLDAAEIFGQYTLGAQTDNLIELSLRDRERIFNLGYFTWVEQQGVDVHDFTARISQDFWKKLHTYIPEWDKMIVDFNKKTHQ